MATKLWLFLRHCAVTQAGTGRAEIEWNFMTFRLGFYIQNRYPLSGRKT